MARKRKHSAAQNRKIHKVMGEYKRGELHSGSKRGPKVKNRRQAVAISMSEAGVGRKRKRRSGRRS